MPSVKSCAPCTDVRRELRSGHWLWFINVAEVQGAIRRGSRNGGRPPPCRDRLDSVELCSTLLTGYATSEPCLCASFAVTGEVIGNCSTVAR